MKVIVAGYPKTGTKSLAIALGELGYNVYDFLEHYWYQGEEWQRLLIHGDSEDIFRSMYKDVDAVLDVPACCFWEQIHRVFPDAKIILTMRDEDRWFRSWYKQTSALKNDYMYKLMQSISPRGRKYFKHIRALCPPAFGFELASPWNTISINETIMKMKFRLHYQYVLKNAPKDKLLVYDVKEGWEPLCKFLEKEIPNKPFPHENVDGDVINYFVKTNDIMKRIFQETLLAAACIILLTAFFLFYIVQRL